VTYFALVKRTGGGRARANIHAGDMIERQAANARHEIDVKELGDLIMNGKWVPNRNNILYSLELDFGEIRKLIRYFGK
jgi:hypothetical protein